MKRNKTIQKLNLPYKGVYPWHGPQLCKQQEKLPRWHLLQAEKITKGAPHQLINLLKTTGKEVAAIY
jgi:hypothetical protein